MPNPQSAKPFEQPLDPEDIVDFHLFLHQGAADGTPVPLILTGEGVASYSLSLTAEAVAAGLTIRQDGGYAPKLVGNLLSLWLSVTDSLQDDARFDENGVLVGVEVTIATTTSPPRRKQRTFLVRIQNQ